MPESVASPIRVLMISKAMVVGTYQRKAEEIAACPGIDLTLVVPPSWKDARGELVLERAHLTGYEMVVEPLRFNGSFHAHYYAGLAKRIASVKPHIVHIDEEPYNYATYHALGLAKKSDAKSLFFTWQNIDRRYPPPFSWMEQVVLRGVDHAIAGTQEAADVFRRKGYSGPMAVIPQFGVDPDFFSPAPQPRASDVFTIGYAGRLVEEKGLDTVIKAMARVPAATHLKLAGDGPLRGELHRLAGIHNIGGSFEVVGSLPSTQMPEFYRSLNVLVLPSLTRPNWKEQFGRVLIEAMACGVPVIGSNSGAIPEVLGGAGLVVPEGDVEAMKVALTSLAQHPRLREQLSEVGRARVMERYTQKQIAAATVDVYREMVK